MSKLALLDPTKTGRQAEDLNNKLRHVIVGQEEAIHQIVRANQTRVAGLSHGERISEQRNFIHAIYFHCGGLDLAPQPTK